MSSGVKPFFRIPTFFYAIYDIDKLNSVQKVLLLFYAKFVQIFFKFTKGRLFCATLNILLPKYSNINFKNGLYFKNLNSEISIFYPNKRISRVIQKKEKIFHNLFHDYC